jgi:hypothetical protein
MAGFKTHITVSALLGTAAGVYGAWQWQLDWAPVLLAFGLGTLGGMLPDLDSDSGVPVRELFGLAAAFIPVLFLRRLRRLEFSPDEILVLLLGAYLFVRYALGEFLKRVTVHRGMFHSIPGMLIAGLAVFILYDHDDLKLRYYMAGSVMLGFLSHLVLDELYAVDLRGVIPRLNQFAGSALKMFSGSWSANLFTYTLLLVLAGAAVKSSEPEPERPRRAASGRGNQPFSFPPPSWKR